MNPTTSSSAIIEQNIGFIGAGKMASALIAGFLRSDLVSPSQIWASDVIPETLQTLKDQHAIHTCTDNREVIAQSDVLFLAIKPQVMFSVLDTIRADVNKDLLVVSIAAGVTLDQLAEHLGDHIRLIRVMPNTPCLVGASASAYCSSPTAKPEDETLIETLLKAVGLAMPTSESLMDAITALSGSGPAYVSMVIESLSEGGVRMGLPRPIATQLAMQTVFGTAKMLLQEELHPAELKEMVTSPGGTTAAGIQVLEQHGLRAAFIDAVEAATHRSQELSQNNI